jgi:hypothetical protein
MEEIHLHEWPANWKSVDVDRDDFLSSVLADMREEFYDKQSDYHDKVAKLEFDAKISRCEAVKKEDDLLRDTNAIRWPVPMPFYVLQAAREFNHSCKKICLNTTDDKIKTFFVEMEMYVVNRFATQAFTTEELWYMYQRLVIDCKWVHTWIDCNYNTWIDSKHLHTGIGFQDVCGASSKLIAAVHRALRKQDKEDRSSLGMEEMYHSDSSEMSECKDNDDLGDDLLGDNDTYEAKVEWDGVWVQWRHGKWGQVQPPHEKAA